MRNRDRIELIKVRRGDTFLQVVQAIEAGAIGIALILDDDGRLAAPFTDGDLRRAVLSGLGLNTPVDEVLAWRKQGHPQHATQAPATSTRRQLLEIMQRIVVRQIPLHDENMRIVDIVTLEELSLPEARAPRALIMAGGFGKRMGKVTEVTPKPLLPVGGIPLIERILRHLRGCGVTEMYISVHHLAGKIMDYLGDGSAFDASIQYIPEDKPLGTAGAVGLLPPSDNTLLVMNGDLLTDLTVDAMLKFHSDTGAWLTMGVRTFEQRIAFGVVECEGVHVHRVVEKPTYRHQVNAGIYLLEPEACMVVPPGQRRDMTDIVADLLAERRKISAFPILGQWLDVGRPDDYELANREAPSMPRAIVAREIDPIQS